MSATLLLAAMMKVYPYSINVHERPIKIEFGSDEEERNGLEFNIPSISTILIN